MHILLCGCLHWLPLTPSTKHKYVANKMHLIPQIVLIIHILVQLYVCMYIILCSCPIGLWCHVFSHDHVTRACITHMHCLLLVYLLMPLEEICIFKLQLFEIKFLVKLIKGIQAPTCRASMNFQPLMKPLDSIAITCTVNIPTQKQWAIHFQWRP